MNFTNTQTQPDEAQFNLLLGMMVGVVLTTALLCMVVMAITYTTGGIGGL